MRSIIILQARTRSSRLPAKILLPIAGMPLVVLAARRASNTGRSILVATSSDRDDDALENILKSYRISYYRGSLHNTLSRVTNALASYGDETVVIRLTADNVFPDGKLIDEVEKAFIDRSLNYICCNGGPSGVPYGMSVEITRLKHLREALNKTSSRFDQEHVTPFIVRKYGSIYFDKYKFIGKGHYRCTVDTYDDYINIQKVFEGISEPVEIPALDLVDKLDDTRYQPLYKSSVPDLVFGTAQLGMKYGITNNDGKPDVSEVKLMLKTAIGNGVVYIDTARAYGNSEDVIGQALDLGWSGRARVITKLSPLSDCPENAHNSFLDALVDASIYESCNLLRRQSLEVLLLHRTAHLQSWDGAVWSRLCALRDMGLIEKLGVSVHTPLELEAALSLDDVRFIQMPFNLLDWRWDKFQKRIEYEKKRRPLVVFTRSALLQGLLSSKDITLWKRANVLAPKRIWNWLENQVHEHKCEDEIDLCFRYVRSKPWIDGIVVGMENSEQVRQNIRYFNAPDLGFEQTKLIEASRPFLDDITLDPSRWLEIN